MTISASVTVQDGSGSPIDPTGVGADVTAGATITVRLADPSGVEIWQLSVIGTDETSSAPVLTINSTTKTATYSAPGSAGTATLFRSRAICPNGRDPVTGRSPYVVDSQFIVHTLASGKRVGAVNETFEANASFGWIAKFNALIRGGGGGGGTPTVTSIAPDVGTAAGGTSVTITGVGFTGATSAALNGANITSFVVVNDTTITGVSAAGTKGAGTNVTVVGTGGTGTGTALWTYLPSGYIQHLRADLGSTHTTTVSAWTDQSGAGNSLTQPTGGKQPTFVAAGGSGIGGKADMTYAGGQYLYGSATDIVTTALTAFCVLKTSSMASGDQPYGKGYGSVQWLFCGDTAVGKLRFEIGGANFANTNAVITDGTPRYFSAVWDRTVSGGLITIYQNGVAQTTTSTFTGTISGTDSNGVGAEVSGSPATFGSGFNGNVPEVLLYPTALSPTDRGIVETYFHNRYGI